MTGAEEISTQSNDTMEKPGLASRVLVFAYGTVVYGYFLGLFLYLIGFVGDFISGAPEQVGFMCRASAFLTGITQ